MGKFKDLTGQRFGRLTVIKRLPNERDKNGTSVVMWECVCDCNPDKPLKKSSRALLSGETNSCGCLIKDVLNYRNKYILSKDNKYDISGKYGILTSTNNKTVLFDIEDYDLISKYKWFVDWNNYCVSITTEENRRSIKMHRLVMGVDGIYDGKNQVDHINHNTCDNRKSNLRILDNSKNQMNTVNRVDNTSGVKGVNFNKVDNKWRAYIQINKNNKHLGYFDNFEDAVKARKDAEEKFQREYSYDNSMEYSKNNIVNYEQLEKGDEMDLKNIKYTSNDIIILYALKLILKRLEKNYNNDEEVDEMIKAIDEKLSWMGY